MINPLMQISFHRQKVSQEIVQNLLRRLYKIFSGDCIKGMSLKLLKLIKYLNNSFYKLYRKSFKFQIILKQQKYRTFSIQFISAWINFKFKSARPRPELRKLKIQY
ncbi:unnamed protein product [Paramecium octaurelia]|uniref:Uncharacterized protein n=1 Tax=Paramecium octaurelia TaxID=43137 RepID=A0A8S1RZJ5_PAROT|nr:unnamed protein product [Paramecium octaurelia]